VTLFPLAHSMLRLHDAFAKARASAGIGVPNLRITTDRVAATTAIATMHRLPVHGGRCVGISRSAGFSGTYPARQPAPSATLHLQVATP
jgi:hypothetical protein